MKRVINYINENNIGTYKENISLSKCTTYKVGGEAKLMVWPNSINDLSSLLDMLNKEKIKYKVLGNGSNVIFSDQIYDGVIIKLDELNNIEINDTTVVVGAGVSLVKLSYKVASEGLSGLEFAAGIPATIGGAVYMNAGAYKSDMSEVVNEVKVLTPDLEIITMKNNELEYSYRSSFFQRHPNYICLEATLELSHGNKDEIREIIESRREKRLETQPLEYPSAGSVFRNPEDNYAGKLIEDCNLKGYKIGGAEVSIKHANFIINSNNATAEDVRSLIKYVHDTVLEKTGYDLKVEQEFINWE